MKKSSAYWQKRFRAVEEMHNQTAKETVQSVTPAFDQAQAQIDKEINAWYGRFAKNNNISMLEAKRLLNTRELKEFRWDVEEYIKYGRQNAIDQQWMKQLENASARFHISRLEALKVRTQNAAERAFGNELDQLDDMAARIYMDGYYHTAYEIQRGLGIGFDVSKIDDRKLQNVLSKPWTADNMTFSDRLWKSKTQMIDALHTELTRTCILGKSPDQAIQHMAKFVDGKVKNAKNAAGRLVMTEAAYFGSAAQKDCFNDLDVEFFEIIATLDQKTSDICQDMDGKHFPMSDYEIGTTAPPFHVWCRSCTAPWFDDDDDDSMRAARDEDGKTYYVPASMKYEDWKQCFVDKTKDPAEFLKKATVEDVIKAAKTIADCKTVNEVENFFREQDWFIHGHKNNPNWRSDKGLSLKGCDLESAKAVYESYDQFFTKYPNMIGKLAAPTSQKLGRYTYAQCQVGFGSGQVSVNTLYFNNIDRLIESMRNDIKQGFHPIGISERTGIVIHELGHALDDYLTNIHRPYGMVNSWKAKYVSAALRPKVMKACGLKVNDTLKEVSDYATKDHFEWFAECFSEYMTSENPRPVAVEFGKQLEELMKGIEWK